MEATSSALALVPEEPTEPVHVTQARQELQCLSARLTSNFADRTAEVKGLMLALIARQHVMLLGVPGTGKSALVNDMCSAIKAARHFQWLLTRYTVPDEVFGTLSLAGLKEDRFKRITTNKLPEAEIAFLDEIWKANSAVLNAMLTIVNERKFHNDGQAVDVPLEMLVGASNELPESDELSALYDRFLFRFQVKPTSDSYNFELMLTGNTDQYFAKYMIEMDDVHACQEAAAALPIEKPVIEALYEIKRACEREAIMVSDRRWKASLSALRAAAFLDSDQSVSTVHLDVLRDIVWSEPAQRPKVDEIIAKHAVSASQVACDLVDSVLATIDKYEADNEEERAKKLPPILREVKNCTDKLADMLEASASKRERAGIASHQRRLSVRKTALQASAKKMLGVE